MVVVTGASSWATWGAESAFGTPVAVTKQFGQNVKVNSFSFDNSMKILPTLGNIEAQASVAGTFKGTVGIECALSNPWWQHFVSGNDEIVVGTAPYIHHYVAGAGQATQVAKNVKPITIETGIDLATDIVRTLAGCVCKSASLDFAVDEPVKATFDFDYKTEALGTSITSVAAESEAPLVFSHANIEIPNATTLTNVKSAKLTINRGSEMLFGLGSRLAGATFNKTIGFDWSVSLPFETYTLLRLALGANAAPGTAVAESTMDFVIDNGGTTTASRTQQITLGGLVFEKFDMPENVDEAVFQNLSGKARTCTVMNGANNTATEP
jgi:hypothetical protein